MSRTKSIVPGLAAGASSAFELAKPIKTADSVPINISRIRRARVIVLWAKYSIDDWARSQELRRFPSSAFFTCVSASLLHKPLVARPTSARAQRSCRAQPEQKIAALGLVSASPMLVSIRANGRDARATK